eukprot:scaffold10272_cov276-Chaetoceros_neogracile.AAC.18
MNEDPLYCQTSDTSSESSWELLSKYERAFINALDLPIVHPRCLQDFFSSESIPIPEHEMDPEFFYEKDMGFIGRAITLFYVVAPALLAVGELWLRLFSCIIAPLVGTYLIAKEIRPNNSENKDRDWRHDRHQVFIMLLGLAASAVLFTDSLYVQAYGRTNGGICLGTLTLISLRRSVKLRFYKKRFLCAMMALLSITGFLLARSERGGPSLSDHPGIDISSLEAGLHYSKDNAFMTRVAQLWPEENRLYDRSNASPFPTGDSLTGIPFMVNSSPEQLYYRFWVKSEVDDEAVAIDIAFPPDGMHSSTKPVYLVLHGLNGGSHEEYVREFVVRRVREGHTCIVMIARGMMDTPVFGFNVFHGARITDVDATAKAIRKGLGKNQMLAGVGYSMGAIILSNYVARSGSKCHLDSAMAVSGGLDMRANLNFSRSMRLWQPMLAQSLKEDFIINKFDGRFRQRLTKEQHLGLMRASSVSEIDVHAIVTYNGFDSLLHYYTEMSAMGDSSAFQASHMKSDVDTENEEIGRIADVSIPFCVLHALDDPLTTWRTMGHNPEKLVQTGSGYSMMFLTESGGHVGWPLGLNPSKNGWKFMNDAVAGFVKSVDMARLENLKE